MLKRIIALYIILGCHAVSAGEPVRSELTIGGGLSIPLAQLPAGTFSMGSPKGSVGAANDEQDRHQTNPPQHAVTISKSFQMGTTEVTQEQYRQVTGANPSSFSEPKRPVDTISWNDAVKFCELLSAQTGKKVRLPTEAEWEYACRAGSESRYHFGEDLEEKQLGDYAWFEANSERQTQLVAQKKPNAWGLYDMGGNVWEWCADYYAGPYLDKAITDPVGVKEGTTRVLRGGCWESGPLSCRSTNRGAVIPERATSRFGFRIVVEMP